MDLCDQRTVFYKQSKPIQKYVSYIHIQSKLVSQTGIPWSVCHSGQAANEIKQRKRKENNNNNNKKPFCMPFPLVLRRFHFQTISAHIKCFSQFCRKGKLMQGSL